MINRQLADLIATANKTSWIGLIPVAAILLYGASRGAAGMISSLNIKGLQSAAVREVHASLGRYRIPEPC